MNAKPPRDVRLDFCRGLALIVIFIDHMPGNPVARWTLQNYAFCDAAEVFVLIAGISTYLAYGSKFDSHGLLECAKAVGRRWLRIYLAYVLLFVSLAAFTALLSRALPHSEYMNYLHLNRLFDDPRNAIPAALTLRYLPAYVNILPLYLALMLAAPAIIFLTKYDFRLALGASLLAYFVARITEMNLPGDLDGAGWIFNPFTWQLIYTLGIVTAHLANRGRRVAPAGKRFIVAAAVAFIAFAFVVAAPWKDPYETRIVFNVYMWPVEKTFLSPLRIANVLALLAAFAFLVSREARFLRSPLARPFLVCGRNSLAIYCLCVVLSCAGYVALNEMPGNPGVPFAVNLIGIGMLFATAAFLEWWYRAPSAAAARLSWRQHVLPERIPAR